MTPLEKTIQFIEKNLKREQDKWESGMRNQFYEWSGVLEKFTMNQENQKAQAECITDLMRTISILEHRLTDAGLSAYIDRGDHK